MTTISCGVWYGEAGLGGRLAELIEEHPRAAEAAGKRWEAVCGEEVGSGLWGRGGKRSVGKRWEAVCGEEVGSGLSPD